MPRSAELEIPEMAQPIVDELIADRLLPENPNLTQTQWSNIADLAEPFAFGGPNKRARHIRLKFAYYHMISDALSAEVESS